MNPITKRFRDAIAHFRAVIVGLIGKVRMCIKKLMAKIAKMWKEIEPDIFRSQSVQGRPMMMLPNVTALLFFMMLVTFTASGQVPHEVVFDSDIAQSASFSYLDLFYAIAIIVLGYFTHKIPLLRSIEETTYRTLLLAVVLGLAWMWIFNSHPLALLFTYAGATTIYEVLLKWAGASKEKPF